MDIVVKERSVYGRVLYTPVSKDAQIIAKLMQQETLARRNLDFMIEQGVVVEIILGPGKEE